MSMSWKRFRGRLREFATYGSIGTETFAAAWVWLTLPAPSRRKLPKRVLFIRHPHTNEVEDRIYRGVAAQITDKGREEADLVAGRMADMGGITHIITSTLPRSVALAERIALVIGETHLQAPPPIIPSDLFVEVMKPSALNNLHRDDPLHVRTMRRIYRFFDVNYRHSDEENRWRLELRAVRAFRFLEQFEGENVIVVTHGKFLRVLFHFIYERGSLLRFYAKADRILKHATTGITEFVLEPGYRRPGLQWNVESWNDIAHRSTVVPLSTLRKLERLP